MASNSVFVAEWSEIGERDSFSVRRLGSMTWECTLPESTLSDAVSTITSAIAAGIPSTTLGTVYQVTKGGMSSRPKAQWQWLGIQSSGSFVDMFADELLDLLAVLQTLAGDPDSEQVDLDESNPTMVDVALLPMQDIAASPELSATIGEQTSTVPASAGVTAGGIFGSIPALAHRIGSANQAQPGTIKVYALGSSIFVQGGSSDPDLTPPHLFCEALETALRPFGGFTVELTNLGVNGSAVTYWRDGTIPATTGYVQQKAATGVPDIVLIGPGPNDFKPYFWHLGPTFNTNGNLFDADDTRLDITCFRGALGALIRQVIEDGADPVLFTTFHPYNSRMPDSGGLTSDQVSTATGSGGSYPRDSGNDWAYIPDGTTDPHFVDITLPSGRTFNANLRYLWGNQAIRELAGKYGAAVIDVEPLWMEAVAANGIAGYFDADGGNYIHPNDAGIYASFGAGVDMFCKSLQVPVLQVTPRKASLAATSGLIARTSPTTRTSTTLADLSQIQVAVKSGKRYRIEFEILAYGSDATHDVKFQPSVPGSSTGTWGIKSAPSVTATDADDSPSTHAGHLNLTSSKTAGTVANDPALYSIWMDVTAGADGMVILQYALGTGTGTVTISSSSVVKWWRIN